MQLSTKWALVLGINAASVVAAGALLFSPAPISAASSSFACTNTGCHGTTSCDFTVGYSCSINDKGTECTNVLCGAE